MVYFRFYTFGLSPRMIDLTLMISQRAILKNAIEIYDSNTWRPYCRKDFSRVIYKILTSNNNVIHKKIYNVGSNKNNYTKKSSFYLKEKI